MAIMQLNLHDLGHIKGLEAEFARWKRSNRRPPRRSAGNGTYIVQNVCENLIIGILPSYLLG